MTGAAPAIPDDGWVAHRSAELPRPRFDSDDARRLLARSYGIDGLGLTELGSQQDRNFRLEHDGGRLVLKVANSGWPPSALTAQDDILRLLAGRLPGLAVPVPVAEPTSVSIDGAEHAVRLLTYVEGRPLARWDHLAAPVVAQLGDAAAAMALELRGVTHPGLERWLQWDLRRAPEVVAELLPRVQDRDLRGRVERATAAAWERVSTVADQLPLQAIHGDLTDDNLVATAGPDGRPVITGVIDFGDLAYGWRVAELVVGLITVLHHADAGPASVLPAVRAFHERVRLDDAEIAALWPLVVLRGAVLVVSGHSQITIDPENAYAASGSIGERAMFEAATSVPHEVMHQLVRSALGLPGATRTPPTSVVPMTDAVPLVVDLSPTSALLDAGRWTASDVEQQLVAAGDAVLRHGEPRLSRTPPLSLTEPETVAVGCTLVTREPLELRAPWDVTVSDSDGVLRLAGPGGTVLVRGAEPGRGELAAAGDVVARAPAGAAVHLQLVLDPDLVPPPFTTASLAPGWLGVCADPSELLGMAAGSAAYDRGRTPAQLMTQRRAVIAEAQERYYGDVPPQFERGWRDLMVDVDARSYVDTINNVAMIGHGDPRVAAASARQWLLLNTNSRFHYAAIVDYSARIAELFPAELDTVFLVNSGSEAVDLALRLAKVHTGRRDVIAISEAYHGWTEASDAVSTSLHDNPLADQTRPDWVHTVLAPNTFRGAYRGEQAAHCYAEDVLTTVAAMAADGRPPAAFICESMYGKEGAIALPDGYLRTAYDAVRALGGLAIADEVQVGFGRLGEYLWGYQQQDVVPDIVTMAKAVGNGQPLGVVITRREVAESFAREGTFFSSAGGSAVSAVVGEVVLDVWRDEQLQDNALRTGRHLRARFDALAEQLRAGSLPAAHERGLFIGAVHGLGLYQGVELVRDLHTLEPATEETLALCDRVLDLGVIMQPTGENFNILKVKPPMCLTMQSADHFVDALQHALRTGW